MNGSARLSNMLRRLSTAITKWLLKTGAISYSDEKLYEYAVYSLVFALIPFAIVSFLGAWMNMLAEGICMMIPFFFIRKFSGGFHFKSSQVCLLLSTCLLLAFLLIVRQVIYMQSSWGFTIFVLLSGVCLFVLSPIDSEERRLSSKEKQVFRRVARILALIFIFIYVALIIINAKHYAVPIGAGIIIAACLQVPCLFYHKTGRG